MENAECLVYIACVHMALASAHAMFALHPRTLLFRPWPFFRALVGLMSSNALQPPRLEAYLLILAVSRRFCLGAMWGGEDRARGIFPSSILDAQTPTAREGRTAPTILYWSTISRGYFRARHTGAFCAVAVPGWRDYQQDDKRHCRQVAWTGRAAR